MIADLREVVAALREVWRDAPGWLAWITLSTVGVAALQAGFPWLWQFAIDALGDRSAPADLRAVGLWTFAVGAAHALLYFGLQRARSVRNAAITAEVRTRTLAAIAGADPEALRGWRTGDLVARLHDDAARRIAPAP